MGVSQGMTFDADDAALIINDSEERINNVGGKLQDSRFEDCNQIEDEGPAHQTFDKAESVHSVSVGKHVEYVHSQ